MTKAPGTAAKTTAPSAPDTAQFTGIGRFPRQQDTVVAEVLSRLLRREKLTGLDGVYEASTTRLGAVVHQLQHVHGWPIESEPMAAGCNDGRVARVSRYALPEQAICKALAAGAAAWCAAVRKARAERRKKASEAIRAAARFNDAARHRAHPGQLNIVFEGPAQ